MDSWFNNQRNLQFELTQLYREGQLAVVQA